MYIGQTADLAKRYAQHRKKPPMRMRPDVKQYRPFADHFDMVPLYRRFKGKEANHAERAAIAHYHARGPKGYNILRGAPQQDRRYHAMAKARKARR